MEGVIKQSDHTLRRLSLVLFVIVFLGTLGFLVLGEDLWHSLYSTIIILLSHFLHGTEEPVSQQLLTILLVIGSYFILGYIVKGAAEYIYGGSLRENRRKRRMNKAISKMKDHYIICGFGRVGRQVAQELKSEGVDFIVIDKNPEIIKLAMNKGFVTITGDPIEESVLKKAGIGLAKSLISSLGEDTDNLFLTLTARSMNPEIFIVSRASTEENISKIKKAGADRVSLPYQIGGYHMAGIALRPAVVDFLDVIVDGKHTELVVEEINVGKGSNLVGERIGEHMSREKTGATVLAINRKDGTTKINPQHDEMIIRGDQLIIMGTKLQLQKLLKEVS